VGLPDAATIGLDGVDPLELAMPIPLNPAYDALSLRAAARTSKDAGQTRRLLALAAIYDGATRTAAMGNVTLQIVRDWVLKLNALGPDGLIDYKGPGPRRILTDVHRTALAAVIENGPTPAMHGVVRWRVVDLCQWLWDEFQVAVSQQTLSRELRTMGYRKLSARPRHHAQAAGAIDAFKKISPRACTRSGARRASELGMSRSGSPMRPVSARRTRSPGAGRGVARGPRPRRISARHPPTFSARSVPRPEPRRA
jgi:putative transposase